MFRNRIYAVMILVLISILLAASAFAHESNTGISTVTIPKVAKGPVMKGDFSDPVWKHGALLSHFTNINNVSAIPQQTSARVLYDSKYIYIGVQCNESSMGNLVAKAGGLDGNVWSDDVVELFFDTANSHCMFYHMGINSVGAVADAKCLSTGSWDSNWNSGCLVKTGRTATAWTVEMAIPFSKLGITPAVGLTLGFNICRARVAGSEEYTAWSLTPGKFEAPALFAHMVLGNVASKLDGVRLATWGSLDSGIADSSTIAVCDLVNTGSKTAAYTVSLAKVKNGKTKTVARKKTAVKPGKSVVLEIPYAASNSDGKSWRLTVTSGGKLVFKAVHPTIIVNAQTRLWQVTDPLYKELLSDTPAGLQKYGAIYWPHTFSPSGLANFAKEYGLRYSNEEALKEYADAKLLTLAPRSSIENPFLQQMSDKYGFKLLFYPATRSWVADDGSKIDYMLDPRSKDIYFNDLRDALTNQRKYIWGIYTSDEMSEYTVLQTVNTYIEHKNDYPYIREINEQVKNQFGFGKYGIPESLDDANRYKWIALRRWVNATVTQWQKEVYDTVQQMAPEIKVISVDPIATHKPVAWDMMAPYFDIATQQLYPPLNPNRQQFGFTTKMVSDLTGKPTFPCTHVEHYPFSTTLEEVRELMSEVIRNGGKGFHFWLKDEIGNNADKGFMMATKWGFPERWRALKEINTLNATMNEVAIPADPDFAILYSEDHYQAFTEKEVKFPYVFPNEPEWAYTFFGPVARGWFKFVNDNMVEDGKAKLSAFKAVVIPAAKFERRSVVNAMISYVNRGGNLVIGDPEAFTNDINGDSLNELRSKLICSTTPSAGKKSIKFTANCSMLKLRNRTLPVSSIAFSLNPPAGSEVMARFTDGSAAVVRTKIGKGSVILFAANPFTESGIGNDSWKSFFTAFSQELGLKTNRKIWRFKFPEYKTVHQPAPEGICLTGNYIKWWQDAPVDIQNMKLPGKYSYTIAPDSIADRGETTVMLTNGKLTDRTKAYYTLKTQLKAEDFVVSWKTEAPVSVTFDLSRLLNVTRLNLWYADQLPGFSVEGSADGNSWTKIGDYQGMPYVKPFDPRYGDVLDTAVKLKAKAQVRYVRLSFGQRDPGNSMTLVECELWGVAPK